MNTGKKCVGRGLGRKRRDHAWKLLWDREQGGGRGGSSDTVRGTEHPSRNVRGKAGSP